MVASLLRIGYQKGEYWERTMFVESSSFAISAVAGELAVEGLVLLLAETPVGWVRLIDEFL